MATPELKTKSPIQYLDIVVGQYYRSLSKEYKDDGKGPFYNFCVENGFNEGWEEKDFDDELDLDEMDPEQFMFMDFFQPEEDDGKYPEFPFDPPIDDKEKRRQEVCNFLSYCWKNGKPPPSSASSSQQAEQPPLQKRRKSSASKKISPHYNTPKNILEITIDTDKKTQKECHKLYSSQCPLLYKDEDVLKKCFSISIKNNRYPFLINLVDSFMRDKALYQREDKNIAKQKDLNMVKWRDKSKYLRAINKEQKKMADTLASGVDTYLRRGCTSWDYGPSKLAKIQDSIRDISYYILMMSNFVQQLINNHNTTPFQIDFAIAINKVKSIKFGTSSLVDDLSDDSDPDSSDEDENDQKFVDNVGDVEAKLKDNKLSFYSFEMEKDLSDIFGVTRCVDNAFNNFKENMKNPKDYPQRRRFCMFIDRRQSDKKGKKDKLIIYDVPSNCNEIPSDNVPEWYFNASKTCIIPSEVDTNNGQMINKNIIRADSTTNGQVVTFSFCVEAEDIIKVYMFWNGRYTRIYPQDLPLILPEIFDMNSNNNKKFTEKQQNEIYSKLKIIDLDYESFYQQATYKNTNFPIKYA